MKIALVADHLAPLPSAAGGYPGDPAARVLALASALAGQGCQVTVYTRGDTAPAARADGAGRAAPSAGVTVEHIPGAARDGLSEDKLLTHIGEFAGHLAERWRRSTPDVVHAHFWTSGMAALAAARGLDVPVVQTFHSLGAGAHCGQRRAAGASLRVRLEAAIGRSAGVILADTSDERRDLGHLGVPQASVRIVPPGVDTTRFRPSGPAAERSQKARLVTIWAPGGQQGLATAVHALAELPDAELVIAAGPARAGLARDPGYLAVTQFARRLGVQDRLICTGEMSQGGMPPLMRSADVLVHLTPSRALAMAPVEAMACGKPVIASAASGAHRDAVIHGNTGFLVPPADHALLARRIRQLLTSPVLLEGYGIAAASRARCRYAWERIGEETLAVYEALAEPGIQAAA